MFGQPLQHRLLVVLANVSGDATKKGLACGVLGHAADIVADQLHGVSTVAAEQAVAILRLGRGTIDNCNKISAYDDSVLAFLRGILGYEGLLDYFHAWVMGDGCWVLGDGCWVWGDGGAYRTVL